MTVKELFLSVGFDNILKALRNAHRNDRSIESVVAYKEAFDIICLTEFEGNGGEVSFDVMPREKWSEPHELPLLANNVEGDYWENTVGKTIVKPIDNPFTDTELAGAILWGMTFYGFTRHAKWLPYEKRFTLFGERAESFERRLYLPHIRDKREKRELKSKEKNALRYCVHNGNMESESSQRETSEPSKAQEVLSSQEAHCPAQSSRQTSTSDQYGSREMRIL